MVTKGGDNPYRPQIPKTMDADEVKPGMINLMETCWNENPDQRPVFTKIISNLKAVNEGK